VRLRSSHPISGKTAARLLTLSSLLLVAIIAASALPSQAAQPPADPGSTTAAANSPPRLESLVLRVYFHDRAERDRLATELGAEEVATTGGYLTVWADRALYNQLLARGLRVEIDEAATRQANNPRLFDQSGPDTFYGGYKTVEEIYAYLDQVVAAYPTLAEKVDIGDSWCKAHPGSCTLPNPNNGYDLWVLHITNQAIAGPKPVFWFDAAIHSREIATPELAMRFISLLLDDYATNADSHWLVDYHDIWVMPTLNPDGHHIVESGGGGNSPYYHRKNANNTNGCTTWPPTPFTQFGVDINRNFSFLWNCCSGSTNVPCDQTYHGVSAVSENETVAVENQIRTLVPDQRGPNLTDAAPITTTGVLQSLHTVAELNLFPWGWTSNHSPNDADLRNIGAHMSATNAGGNGYDYGQTPELLYIVDGDSVTWAYGELGMAAYTTELGGSDFLPDYSEIPGLWDQNRGMLTYLAKIARTPYLTTRGPDANTVAASPALVEQGTPSTLTASINYAWTGNTYAQNVADAEYYIDTPPWAGGTAIPMTGSFTGQTVAVQATVSTGALSIGRHILFVRGRGVNSYSGFQSWGPISAVFLDVVPVGAITPSPTATALQPSATPTATPLAPTTTPTTPPSATATAPAVTPTPPCNLSFTDVPPGYTFYPYVQWMVCRGYISGYPCGGPGEPCSPNQDPYFRPGNSVTRGQVLKMAVNASGWAIFTPFTPTFEDVPEIDPFYQYIETGVAHNIINGYPCGGPGEPCNAPGNRPYFRPNNDVTRGQMSKVIALAKGYPLPTPVAPTFQDVPMGSPFFSYVEAVAVNGIVTGYPCGGIGEPCPGQYFRPGNNATRGQVTKFVTLAYGGP
jgi:hypothetical protein